MGGKPRIRQTAAFIMTLEGFDQTMKEAKALLDPLDIECCSHCPQKHPKGTHKDRCKWCLKEKMHPDWVVLRWNYFNERCTAPSILYAVIGDGYAVVNSAWYHETIGWCPHGGTPTTMWTDEIEHLLKLVKEK